MVRKSVQYAVCTIEQEDWMKLVSLCGQLVAQRTSGIGVFMCLLELSVRILDVAT